MKKETRIKIIGKGGQGIKFLTNILGLFLKNRGFYVSYYFLYDAAMRGGNIESELVFSLNPASSPMGESFDFLVMLSPVSLGDKRRSRKIIQAKNNMLALGKLLRNLGFKWQESLLLEVLPSKNRGNNLKDIKAGYFDES